MKFGALILYTRRFEELAAFYRRLGLPLEKEQHGEDGPLHLACEIGPVHFAIYAAEEGAEPPAPRAAGSSILGWEVSSVTEALASLGARVINGPEARPWGTRAVVLDPDGRTIEIWSSQSG